MTKLKAAVFCAVLVTGVAIPVAIQHRQNAELRNENAALRQKVDELLALTARAQPAVASRPAAESGLATNDQFRELLKLRGDVTRLRDENATVARSRTNGPSMLSGMTADPAVRKGIRDQQKLAMGIVYKDLGKKLKLNEEQEKKFVDLLADHVMDNLDSITELLRDKRSPEEINAVFAGQESALAAKVEAMLGPDGYAAYEEYTQNLTSHFTAQQFKALLGGDKAAKDGKAKQIYDMMREETAAALAAAGLPANYQTLPNLNFRNFASEQEAERNLAMLDNIYDRVTTRAANMLEPKELQKFGEYRTNAISANRMSLMVNRRIMAPGGQ